MTTIDLSDAFSVSMSVESMSEEERATLVSQIPNALAEEAPALARAKSDADALDAELKALREAMEKEFSEKHAELIAQRDAAKKQKDDRELRTRLLLQTYAKAGGEEKSVADVFSLDSHVSIDDGAYQDKPLIEWIVTRAPFLAAGLLSVNKAELKKFITLISTNETDEMGKEYRDLNPTFEGMPVYPRVNPVPKIEWKKLAQKHPVTSED